MTLLMGLTAAVVVTASASANEPITICDPWVQAEGKMSWDEANELQSAIKSFGKRLIGYGYVCSAPSESAKAASLGNTRLGLQVEVAVEPPATSFTFRLVDHGGAIVREQSCSVRRGEHPLAALKKTLGDVLAKNEPAFDPRTAAKTAATPTPAVSTPPLKPDETPPAQPKEKGIGPWVVTAVGVAALGLGAAFALGAKSAESDRIHATSNDAVVDAEGKMRTRRTASVISLAAGAAGVGFGLSWRYVF